MWYDIGCSLLTAFTADVLGALATDHVTCVGGVYDRHWLVVVIMHLAVATALLIGWPRTARASAPLAWHVVAHYHLGWCISACKAGRVQSGCCSSCNASLGTVVSL
jgi:hypothetical protein